jgi:hypothetical protein
VSGTIGRYAVMVIIGFLLLLGLLLLVRPFIFSLAPPRDDSVYAVATVGELTGGPIQRELLLNSSEGLLGEQPNGIHAVITVVVSRTVTGQYAVVNGWSPVNDCALTLGADRVTDCRGLQWTLAGDPFDIARPPLQRFPVRVENGALVADLTSPVDDGG